MMPSPPSWIIARITHSPNEDQWVGVSTTTSPVTQMADVAVNTASEKVAPPSLSVAKGSINNAVPMAIAPANRPTMTWAG